MSKYFTMQNASEPNVIMAYRGTVEENTLTAPPPPDDQAFSTISLAANLSNDEIEEVLIGQYARNVAKDTNSKITIRVDDDGSVYAWYC